MRRMPSTKEFSETANVKRIQPSEDLPNETPGTTATLASLSSFKAKSVEFLLHLFSLY